MYDYRRGGSVFGAFLLGGLFGAVLGVLFAPRPGKESREMLADAAEKYLDEGKRLCESGKVKVAAVYESGRETVEEKSDEIRVKIEQARDRLREQVESVSETAREKMVEVVPVAKEAAHKAAEAVKSGAEIAEKKAQETLDLVAEKAAADREKRKPSAGAGGLPPL